MSDPSGIFNWRRLDDRITTSGQPSEAQLAAIRDLGVAHVINLALHSHEKALPDETATVTALGMAYTHIPVDFDRPTEADYERFRAVMAATAEVPVHVHCIVNARVTAFLYRYQREVLAGDEAKARAFMGSVCRRRRRRPCASVRRAGLLNPGRVKPRRYLENRFPSASPSICMAATQPK